MVDVLHAVQSKSHILVRALGGIGLGGALFFLVVLAGLHWVEPSVSPVTNYVSDYANTSYGTLFRASLIIHGVGNAAVALGLAAMLAGSRPGRLSTDLFGATAAGMIVAGIFSTDVPEAARTWSGLIHTSVAATSMPIEGTTLFLFVQTFRGSALLRPLVPITRFVAVAGVMAILSLFSALLLNLPVGLPERAILLAYLPWEIATAATLARYSNKASGD